MSYTNETTHYGIPLPLGSDKTTPMDYNTSAQEVDTVLFEAKTDSASALQKANQLQQDLSTTNNNVTGVTGRVTTLEGTVATQGQSILQNTQDIANVRADALDMIVAKDEGTAQVASVAVAEGEYFRYNDVLYIATQAIAVGDTIVPNTNCKATNVGTELNQLNTSLTMLTEVTVSDYSAELSAYDRIYVKDKSKVYIKGRFVGNFTQGVEKKMFNVSQVPKIDFTTNPTYVMFNCVISGSSTSPAYGYIKANGDVCVIPSETITGGTCILDFEYQY